MFEKVIHIHLLAHLNDNNIIIPQYGFTEAHSCTQQLLRVMEYATLEINKNRITQLLLFDIEKAFDSVWHKTLIYKLRKIRTPHRITNLVASYLTDRQMYIEVNGVRSGIKVVRAGVPQSSILGPTLQYLHERHPNLKHDTNSNIRRQHCHMRILMESPAGH